MRLLFPGLLFLLSLVPIQGEPTLAPPSSAAVINTESHADLDGTIGLRWALSHGDIRVFCAWQGRAASAGRSETGYPTLALSSPWLVCGPLTGAGLLREASNPLGFSPGSDVFAERTGVLLDGSLPSGRSGLLCMPVPDALGFYCLPCSGGGCARGCFASIQAGPGLRAEGFLSFSKSEPEGFGEEWFLSTARDPGGAMTSSGVRLEIDYLGLALGATVAGSFSERAPPGSFQLLHGSWRGNEFFAEALVGRIDAAYRRPGGQGSTAASAFSASTGLEGPSRTVRLSYAVRVDQPGFAPRPFLESSEVMGLVIEHVLAAAPGFCGSCRAETERRISRDSVGALQESSRYSASLKGKTGRFEAAATAAFNQPGGIAISLDGAYQAAGGSPRLCLESRLERLNAGCPVLTALAGLRLEQKDAALSFESGVADWIVGTAATDVIRHFRLKVSWSTRCVLGK